MPTPAGDVGGGAKEEALLAILERLATRGYRFVTPTPETHRRVIARARTGGARDLRDIFGWSLDFRRVELAPELVEALAAAGMLAEEAGDALRSRVRVSSIGSTLFLHSAYPTDAADAVFLGPDTYRFVRFLRTELASGPLPARIVDVGAGAGAGAIMADLAQPGARLTLADVNPLALHLARVNARAAGLAVETLVGSGLEPVEGAFDLAVMNPPFIIDGSNRAYRDGGAMHGAALSLDWALAAAARVAPGGRVLLYTGSAIVDGADALEAALRARLPGDCALRYEEIDPDIFGEELDNPGYEAVERIAAVGAVITRRG